MAAPGPSVCVAANTVVLPAAPTAFATVLAAGAVYTMVALVV
jgi:hypothetical protein